MTKHLGREMLGKHVRAFLHGDRERTQFVGVVTTYTEEPSFTIRTEDGEQRSWLARLCEAIDPPLEEPGIWGVVEAACVHSAERRQWVRHSDGLWWPHVDVERVSAANVAPLPDDWDSLAAPLLIRDGVPE